MFEAYCYSLACRLQFTLLCHFLVGTGLWFTACEKHYVLKQWWGLIRQQSLLSNPISKESRHIGNRRHTNSPYRLPVCSCSLCLIWFTSFFSDALKIKLSDQFHELLGECNAAPSSLFNHSFERSDTRAPPSHQNKRWWSRVSMCLNFLPLRNSHEATTTVTRGQPDTAGRRAKNDRGQTGRLKMVWLLTFRSKQTLSSAFTKCRCKTYFTRGLMNAEVTEKKTPVCLCCSLIQIHTSETAVVLSARWLNSEQNRDSSAVILENNGKEQWQ